MNTAAPVKPAAIEHVPVILDQPRVLPDQIVGKLMDHGLHRQGATFQNRFPPAADPLIGVDFQKAPSGRDDVGREFCDLHGAGLRRARRLG